jgi:hypothetical protein
MCVRKRRRKGQKERRGADVILESGWEGSFAGCLKVLEKDRSSECVCVRKDWD